MRPDSLAVSLLIGSEHASSAGEAKAAVPLPHQESRFYCQRRGNEGNAGDGDSLRISKLLISKSLPGGQKPIEGSTKSPKAILDDAHASPEGRGPKARVNPSLSATKKSL